RATGETWGAGLLLVRDCLSQELLIEPNDFVEKLPQLAVVSEVPGYLPPELRRDVVGPRLPWSERHRKVIGRAVPPVVCTMTSRLAALLVPLDQASPQQLPRGGEP